MGKNKNNCEVPAKPAFLLMLMSPFCIGLYHVWLSSLTTIFLLGYLVLIYRLRGELILRRNIAFLAVSVFLMMLLLSGLWAIDRGEALFGFVKFLPVFLFLILITQFPGEKREQLWLAVPMGGVGMTIISGIFQFIPGVGSFFLVNGRLAGLFQYPNTYAIYLLCGVICLAVRETVWQKKILCVAILFFGILLSGSRTTAVLLAAALAVIVLGSGNKQYKIKSIQVFFCCSLICFALAVVTNHEMLLSRYLVSPAQSSTFLGRLLYARDAWPVILKNPQGLGYGGYVYVQGTIQTGVYSVRHVHNELLQILLDVGWIPAILMVAALGSAFRYQCFSGRLIVGVLTIHCLFDFDLQFVAMDLLLALLLDVEHGRQISIKGGIAQRFVMAVAGISASLCLWVGTVDFLYWQSRTELALTINPAHTQSLIIQLKNADTAQEMERLANRILEENQMVSLAYDAKAEVAFYRGDAEEMIYYKRRAIELDRYKTEGYEDYFDKLLIYARVYLDAGMEASALYCREQLLRIPRMLEDVRTDTSSLAWKIYDKPRLELAEKYQSWINLLGAEDWRIRLRTATILGMP